MQPLDVTDRAFSASFWDDYLFVDEDAPREEQWRYVLPLNMPAELVIENDLGMISLQFRGSKEEELVEIAFDDEAHWHPHVLRWEEVQAIGHRIARAEPSLPHPGIPLLLLSRFAPVVSETDAHVAIESISQAMERIGILSPARLQHLIRLIDFRNAAVTWRHDPATGWFPDQHAGPGVEPGLYSLRHPENATFPWEAWRRFVAEIGSA